MIQPSNYRREFLKQALATGLLASLPTQTLRAVEKKLPKKPLYSCSTVNFSSLPLEKACERIAALGFDAVDIWHTVGSIKCPHFQEIVDDLQPKGLNAILDKHRLKLGSFSLYSGGYPQHAKWIAQWPETVIVQGSRARKNDNLTDDMKQFLEEIKPKLELCEKYDAYLAVENHSGNALLDKMDSLKAFTDLNRNKRLGIALAPYHLMHNGESVADAIRVCGPQMFFIYFWTNEGGEKQMPGVGQTDVSGWFHALNDIKYSRYVTPFMHHEPEPDRMEELHRISRKFLDQTFETAFSQ